MPGENQVTVGGTPALVTAASEVQITFVVPGGVTSGLIVVTSPAGSATSAEPFTVPGGVITTVAGTGAAGFNGDGQPAASAQLKTPTGVAADGAGNLFIADQGNHRIRRVDARTGIITTVAGDGTAGFGGDAGPATSALLNSPFGLAFDRFVNFLFIADTFNQRIRRLDLLTGIITTVAGTGTLGFSGDGASATSAELANPTGVGLDEVGNLLIADFSSHRIRRVDLATGLITTVAGDGTESFGGDNGAATSAQLDLPFGLVVDQSPSLLIGRSGDIYIADQFNHRTRKVRATTGIITTVAGSGPTGIDAGGFGGDNGPATSAQLRFPLGVALDARGNLLIADADNQRIRRVDAATGIITTVAGSGPAGVGLGGFGGDGGPATDALLNTPFGVALDRSGNLFIGDFGNHRIRKVTAP